MSFFRLLSDVHRGRVSPERAGFKFSPGEKRLDLAALLRGGITTGRLRDQPALTDERIRTAMASGTTSTATLTQPIPVVIFYTTAIVDPAGRALFQSDIHGYDRSLGQALRTR